MAKNEGKHVMLSYNHASQAIVKEIYHYLLAENIPVWFDERDMGDNMYDSMAKAINDASVVCCFLTQDYEDSKYCKLELEHAHTLGKRIIPCMMINRKKWKPSKEKGVGIIVGSIIAIDFSDFDTNRTTKMEQLINRIKQESSTVSTQSWKLSELIRKTYLRESRLKRMVNEGKSFPIEESYVNLAIVESKEQQEKERKLKGQDADDAKQHGKNILSTYEEIYGAKTSIDVAKIFDKCKDETKKVLVLGRAGIGKSTFCQYITYRWATGDLWPQYDLIVLIRLRKLTNTCYSSGINCSPFEIVKKEYFPFRSFSSDEQEQFEERCENGKVLWILDGYDEFVNNSSEMITEVFHYLLETQHHILTSRPYVITLSYELKMEITGFTDENIEKYIEQFFAQVKDDLPNASVQSMKLLNFLKSNSNIWGVAHIPVNLELICTLWGDTEWSKKKTLTLTMLYENITKWLCQRHLIRQNIDCKSTKNTNIYSQCDQELQFFETLAFNAMEHSDIILPPALLRTTEKETQCLLEDHPQLLNFGILKLYDDKATGTHNSEDQHYYFIHLSFQEYFAARHLLQLLKDSKKEKEAIDFINTKKYNRRFLYVFIFASGLLTQSEYQTCMKTFWKQIGSEPADLVGLIHIKLVIECFDELAGQTVFAQSVVLMRSLCHWLDICINTKSMTIVNHLLESLMRTNAICNNSILQDKICQLIDLQKPETEKYTHYIIIRLPITSPIQKLITKLNDCLQDDDPSARQLACDTFTSMTQKAVTNEFIPTLSKALSDENWFVRIEACNQLSRMGEKAATKEAIAALINALQDGDSIVRKRSSETLVEMGKNGPTNEVISPLIDALQHGKSSIQIAAAKVLGNIGEKAATNQVISALLDALNDKYPYVGQSACFALGKMGEKVATNEIITTLIDLLPDTHISIRIGAIQALENIYDKVANNDIIFALIKVLSDKDSSIRARATKALVKMSEQSVASEVTCALIDALRNEDSHIRQSTCSIFENIGENAATNEVIGALLNALSDEDPNVRRSACSSIGSMGENAATNEVISTLIKTLRDVDLNVGRGAYEALVKFGEKSATNELISAFLNALRDNNSSVRGYACSALESVADKVTTKEVISALINALQDKDSSVRRSACSALGKMGTKAATKEVISALTSALRDEAEDVRGEACCSIGNMGKKAATDEVISALMNALSDENIKVRLLACTSFGNMGENAATNEVISELINLLRNQNFEVKQSAYSALEKMTGKATTSVMTSAFINGLQDEDPNIRIKMCYLLRKVNKDIVTNEMISTLINTLQDKDPEIKKKTCYLLQDMSRKAATNEMVSTLVNTLHDKDWNVRLAVCGTLMWMNAESAMNDVISTLIDAMQREKSDNRESVCDLLARINKKTPTNRVISTLINAVRDERWDVKRTACDAVQRVISCNTTMKELDSQTRQELIRCVRECSNIQLKNISLYQLINVFVETENDDWLLLITFTALLQAVAITALDKKIRIYHGNDVIDLCFPHQSLLHRFIDAFKTQRIELQSEDESKTDTSQ